MKNAWLQMGLHLIITLMRKRGSCTLSEDERQDRGETLDEHDQ